MMKNKYKVMITSCWVLLIICFVLKIFGANWFEPILTDGKFVEFCNWLDGNWIKYIFSSILYMASTYIFYLIITKRKIGEDLWILIIMLPVSILKVKLPIIGLILDLSLGIFIPLIRNKFRNWLAVIIGNILLIVFQIISLATKNIGGYITSDSILISTILSIDYYIMLVLYYLYTHYEKKGE